jgi:prepilin-type N-terminal cleavage/methylation domain-containing protein
MIKKLFKFLGVDVSRGFTRTPKTWVSGFTLLESVVAIFVLSLAITAAFSAVRQGLLQTNHAKNEVRAFHLAQEAIEVLRNERDQNRLSTLLSGSGAVTNWLTDISGCIGSTCRVDASGPGNPAEYLYPCGENWDSCPYMRQDPTTLVYGYDFADPETNFKREIQIELVNPNELAVTVRVSWKQGIINYEFKVKTLLLNWL